MLNANYSEKHNREFIIIILWTTTCRLKYLENTHVLQGWPNRSSIKIMTSWFRYSEEPSSLSLCNMLGGRNLGIEARILNTVELAMSEAGPDGAIT